MVEPYRINLPSKGQFTKIIGSSDIRLSLIDPRVHRHQIAFENHAHGAKQGLDPLQWPFFSLAGIGTNADLNTRRLYEI